MSSPDRPKAAFRTSALRMRRCRDRQRAGSRVVTIELYYDDLDGLAVLGQIANPDDLDQRALSAAVADYLTDAIRRDLRKRDASQGTPGNVVSSGRSTDSEKP